MRDYDWNPYKDDWHHSDEYKNSDWDYDPRDENYYLGRINQQQSTDLSRRYYSDGYTDRYYRNNEVKELKENNPMPGNSYPPSHPYKNNDFFGNKKRNYSPEGPHRGKGPKNYTRPSESIKDDAANRLFEDSLVDASAIELEIKGNDLILSGTVPSLFQKHRAEALVINVSGVKEVENKLKIKGK